MHDPIVHLDSGGYIVINQTEALVAVDVNSGRATKERNIEETALQTNKQAAKELSRQLKLRNLSGLIIIDFIDMLDNKNNRIIENTLKQSLSSDRAKIQVGQISSFGLLEMSRQRIRPSIYEAEFIDCHACHASGKIRSLESQSLKVLRQIQEKANGLNEKNLYCKIKKDIAINILNNKRKELSDIETRVRVNINIIPDEKIENECEFIEHINAFQSNNRMGKKKEFSNRSEKRLGTERSRPKLKNINHNAVENKLKNKNAAKSTTKNMTTNNKPHRKIDNKIIKKTNNIKTQKKQ